ncbi:MAG: 4Fe-4S binding protein [Fibrobacter sp.]|nr:4Fe-4S binding protein [Fibrobacter sp.]
MRKIRIAIQAFFFLAFIIFFFLLNKYPTAYTVDSDFFLKLNPLTTLLVSIASRQFFFDLVLISGIVFVATIIFGRIFCGAVCPLGTLIDIVDAALPKIRSNERRPAIYLHRLKYILLIITVTLTVFGILVPLFFDPILLITRIFTNVVNPALNVIISDSHHAIGSVFPDAGSYLNQTFTTKVPLFSGIGVTIFLVFLIFGGTFWDKRFWCQYICPSGAFFGLLSNWSIYKRKVDGSKCNSCARCARACPTRAIPQKDVKKTSASECILCGVCVSMKDECNRFSFGKISKNESVPTDVKRRHVLGGLAGGLIALPAYKATASLKRDDHGKLIRPPASLPETEFLAKCLACGSCMKACPTNALQPCMFTDGFNKLYTPKIVPKIGGCEGQCAICGNVCPTGAIRKVLPTDKPYIKLGTAVLDKNKCIAWEQNKECVVCDEVCPFNAIDSLELETTGGKFTVPVVKEDLCMGCGMCEHHCPVNDQAAIAVMRFGENRKSSGDYLTKSQREKMDIERKKTGHESLDNIPQENKSDLPVGFEE